METKTDCKRFQLLVKHAYSACNDDGFWHVVTDAYYTCADPCGGVYGPRRVSDIPTKQPCGQGATPPKMISLFDQVVPDLGDKPCQSPEYVGDIIILRCENGVWEWHTYLLYECPDGTQSKSWKSVHPTTNDCSGPPGSFPFPFPILPLPLGVPLYGVSRPRFPRRRDAS